MKYLVTRLFPVLLLFLTTTVQAELPSKIQAEYDVVGFGMTLAKISETFTRNGDQYSIESITRAVGFLARLKPETVRVTSSGKITTNGLQPFQYSITRELDTGKNARAVFNWEKSILTHHDYKGINDLPLPKGAQDRMSVQYHLPLMAKSGQQSFSFSITDGNNLENYRFTVSTAESSVEVPLGTCRTRLLNSTPIAEEVKYEIWMSLEHDYFPCKVVVTDNKGGKLTQVLTSLIVTP